MSYVRRILDDELDDLMDGLPAIAIEGAKGVGKTATASARADSVISLDSVATREIIESDPQLALGHGHTTFIDEWQYVPDVWNLVRHAVDNGAVPGRFLLAGSATPKPKVKLHSGAGRIVRLMLRPMSLPERAIETPTVSMRALLSGGADIAGMTDIGTADYAQEICASGFPGIRSATTRLRARLLDSYIDHIVDHEIPGMGETVRRPTSLKQWLTAYGIATATTASYASLLSAATPGESQKPSKPTTMNYRDLLQRVWVLDPVPAWSPVLSSLKALGQAPKHHLVDPALTVRLAGASVDSLLRGDGPEAGQGVFLGALFESLAAQTVRVLAQACEARVSHARLQGGQHEIDLIVEGPGLRILAIEVKLSTAVRPADVVQLNWLEQQMPDRLIDKVLINTGAYAYRRKDGVAVVPLALLGL